MNYFKFFHLAGCQKLSFPQKKENRQPFRTGGHKSGPRNKWKVGSGDQRTCVRQSDAVDEGRNGKQEVKRDRCSRRESR
jgi:hypothetical protein